eukprot:CAMPEP_0201484828 /NCGR_PEP_ID=MMETSP0151_2-20130828/8982_1 /ASSEMBLY_ACC=CAM_ASM_000257 /TAXON_ID=200890 /ORGANISM="Paramoeba atlantica, Strain 621/1 / CCAP 1560/9" /LENGTH=64 /DNA_ID=CAMNT_0047868669 /DNA_START=344 /DNA_END=538 /DNA_ORIENTATION=-
MGRKAFVNESLDKDVVDDDASGVTAPNEGIDECPVTFDVAGGGNRFGSEVLRIIAKICSPGREN